MRPPHQTAPSKLPFPPTRTHNRPPQNTHTARSAQTRAEYFRTNGGGGENEIP